MAVKTNKSAARRAREDRIYSLILAAFGICIVLELFLIALYRSFYSGGGRGLERFLGQLWWLGFVPAAGCGLWLFLRKRIGQKYTLQAWGLVAFC